MGRKPDLEVRERILQEAEHVIHLKGYNAASLEEIAKACGMSRPNLLHHYGSKAELALAVLDYKIEDFQTRRVAPLCAQAEPEAAVERMFLDAACFFDGNGCKAGCFIGNIALEMSDVDEQFRERVGRFFAAWTQSVAECLKRCQDAGYFTPALDPQAAAETLVSLYEGAIMQAKARRDASVFVKVAPVARMILEHHKVAKRRDTTMGPKTPCGC
ncbi:MAG: TetR family transcriptional regulator C-terminal domain-containing protein [Elusimicrobiota bacterium]|nr:TetR family transcriptional regulator C-terminal domain-containing protein [Elusimicrobiota bacterium]